MPVRHRFAAPLGASLLALMLAVGGCAPASPSPSPAPSTPPPAASADPEAAAAFSAAMCPIFIEIVELDPRLAGLRAVGEAGAPTPIDAEEIASVVDELGVQLDALEAVPIWNPGQLLRFHLITALHGIRAHLLAVHVEEATAFAQLATIPYVASDAMDLAMADAVAGGLVCEE